MILPFQAHWHLLRLNRPFPILFLFTPCLWGLWLGAQGLPSGRLLGLFFLGTCLTRTAGCVYNDWVDRPLDQQVRRCATRPLAAGILKPWVALVWVSVLLMASLVVLWFLPPAVQIWGLISGGLLFIYPWMKRLTRWPQVIMGMAFTMGLPMGYSYYEPSLKLPWSIIILYISGVWWAMLYDTLYAHQDRDDDKIAGVKSSTQILSNHPKVFLILCLGGWYVSLMIFGYMTKASDFFYLFSTFPLIPMGWIIKTLDLSDPGACLQGFKRCFIMGFCQTWAVALG